MNRRKSKTKNYFDNSVSTPIYKPTIPIGNQNEP